MDLFYGDYLSDGDIYFHLVLETGHSAKMFFWWRGNPPFFVFLLGFMQIHYI